MANIKRRQAVSMFASLKNLIASLAEDARLQKFEDKDCQLATAALLTRVATVEVKCRKRGEKSFAAAADRSAVDLYHFTDERVNEFESNIIWRIADLLGVSSRQRIELRQRVVADRVALNPA
jgi:uncharacterized tellurite resistance protein B-like protein